MGKKSRSRMQTIAVRPSILMLSLLTALAANAFVESPLLGQVAPQTVAICGNTVIEAGETCDDGNGKPGDGCSTSCQAERCGDNIVNGAEECDTGGTDSVYQTSGTPKAGCSAQCAFTYCGDGQTQTALGEQCDDGNRADGDTCTSLCRNPPAPVCDAACWQANRQTALDGNADGVITKAEAISAAETSRNIINSGGYNQKYDIDRDGVLAPIDTLRLINFINDPAAPICGNGGVHASEQCDDGNENNNDSCTNLCRNAAVAADNCAPPAIVAGSVWQNPVNPLNVDNNNVINGLDGQLIISRLNQSGAGQLPDARPASDYFYDVNGDGWVTALDSLMIVNYINRQCPTAVTSATGVQQAASSAASSQQSSAAAAAPSVTLSSVQLSCSNGTPMATVTYDKNFDYPCAHLLHTNGAFNYAHPGNVFCKLGGETVSYPLSDFRNLVSGQQVKLCHGNNYGICGTATVTGSAECAATPVASSASSSAAPAAAAKADPGIALAFIRGTQGSNTFIAEITVTNGGTARASRVIAAMGRPAGSQFVTGEGCSQRVANGAVYCDPIDLEPGASRTYALTFQAQQCPLVASVTAAIQSANDGNAANNLARLINHQISCGAAAQGTAATLAITQENIGREDTAVPGQQNVTLMRFSARAGDASGVRLTGLRFAAAEGNVLYAHNYSLWIDTDNNGIVDASWDVEGPQITPETGIVFDNLEGNGVEIPAGTSVIMELHADIPQSPLGNRIAMTFFMNVTNTIVAESLETGAAITGINVDNNCAGSCSIFLTRTYNKAINISSRGSLFITKDATPARSRQLLAGTLGSPVMRLNFRAQDENIDVTDLQFTSMRNMALSVDRLELFRADETQAFAVASVAGCGTDQAPSTLNGNSVVTFCAKMVNRELVVLKSQETDVLVRPRIKNDENGAISGEDIQLLLISTPIVDSAAGRGAVRARGMTSSQELVANDGNSVAAGEIFIGTDGAGINQDIVSGLNEIVLSKITSIANINPDAHDTHVPTGTHAIGRFAFTAAPNTNTRNGLNKVAIGTITFAVTNTNVDMNQSAYKFYNAADNTYKIPCRVAGGTGSDNGQSIQYVQCPAAGQSILTTIDSGENANIVLEGEITNAQVDTAVQSVLQVSLYPHTTPTEQTVDDWRWADIDAAPGSINQSFAWFELADTVINSTRYTVAAGTHAAAQQQTQVAAEPAVIDNSTCFQFRVNVPLRQPFGSPQPPNVTVGQRFQADLTMGNAGNQAWDGNGYSIVLENPQDQSIWGIASMPMENVIVRRGYYYTFRIYPVVAPATPGTYAFNWRMAKNGVPFGAVCRNTITVDPAPAATAPGGALASNCTLRNTATTQAGQWGEQGPFRRTSDQSFMLFTELVNGVSKVLKGIDMNTCEVTTLVTADQLAQHDSIWESTIADDGTILYAERGWYYQNGSPENIRGKLVLMNRNTKAKAVIVPRAPGNGDGDRAMISRDGQSVAFTASYADLDNNPNTGLTNTDGSRELFLWKNGTITQITNFFGGTDQYTTMGYPEFEDPTGRFISIKLDFDPVTLRRHQGNVAVSSPAPSGMTVWPNRLYLYDTQTGQFHRITDATVGNTAAFQATIDARIAEITGRQSASGYSISSVMHLLGGILNGGMSLAGALLR